MSWVGPPVSCRKVSKAYGYAPALREVDFEAEKGSLVALIGDNGAGKSTLLKVLATLLRPDSGECRVLGQDVTLAAQSVRGQIGYLGHESMLDKALTLRENLRLFASLYGLANHRERVEDLIGSLGAGSFADNPVSELSRGQEQACALGRALVHGPSVILLDEPANALDPKARERLFGILKKETALGHTVIFSTHDQESARELASRVVRMAQGRIQSA